MFYVFKVFTQFNRSCNHFSWCKFTHGWNTALDSLGFGYWSVSFFTKLIKKKDIKYEETRRETPHQTSTPPKPNQDSNSSRQSWTEWCWFCSPNAKSSRFGAMLYIFEGNEAMIKMIIKGRSPTMRHVSETPRVALVWLFDRINMDPKIQVKHVDAKHHLADILTKANLTRDEWNTFFICLTSDTSAPFAALRIFSLSSCTKAMAKKMQEEKREERIVAKSKPTFNLVSCCEKFFDCAKSNCVEKSGDTQGTVSKWLGKYRETWSKRIQSRRSVEFSQAWRSPTDDLNDLDVNTAIWGILMTVTLQAVYGESAVYQESTIDVCETVDPNDWEVDQRSHRNYRIVHDWLKSSRCGEKHLQCVCGRVVHNANSETYVFADSVFCPGSLSDRPVRSLEKQDKVVFGITPSEGLWSNRRRANGLRVEKFPRIHYVVNSQADSKMMTESKCEPEHYQGRIIFTSMYNDIDWEKTRKQRKLYCECSQSYWACSKIHARTMVISILEHRSAKKWFDNGTNLLRRWWSFLRKADILYSMHPAHHKEENCKAKEKEWNSFNGSDETLELILRTVISVNQLSVYGAVAYLCGELARDSKGTGNPERLRIWNVWLCQQNSPLLTIFLRLMPKFKETCCVNMSRNSQNFLNKRNWPNSAPMLVSRRILRKGNPSLHLMMIHLTVAELRRIRSSDIPLYQCLGERRIRKQKSRKEIYSFQRKWRNGWIDPSHCYFCYFCQSAQYLRSSCRIMQRIGQRLTKYKRTRTDRVSECQRHLSDWHVRKRKPVARLRAEIRKTSWRSKINQKMLWRSLQEENGKRQFFITLEEEEPEDMQTFCREYTLPRDQETSRARGWIRGNTKIGPVLDVKVYRHQGRYGVEIKTESLFRDRTCSSVRVVNGINKYVTETSDEIPVASVRRGVQGNLLSFSVAPSEILDSNKFL